MKLIVFGATGMVGAGVMREALAAAHITEILVVGRSPSGVIDPRVRELLLADLFDVDSIETQVTGWDACVWAVGISSIGLDEAAYARITEELTLRWARALLRLNPGISFCYCSAMGAGGRTMWARVRQRVEEAIRTMGFRHAGCVRPGFIQPGPGIVSKVRFYQVLITLGRPLFPVLVRTMPSYATTSERLGRAMLRVVEGKADRFILESADINRVAGAP